MYEHVISSRRRRSSASQPHADLPNSYFFFQPARERSMALLSGARISSVSPLLSTSAASCWPEARLPLRQVPPPAVRRTARTPRATGCLLAGRGLMRHPSPPEALRAEPALPTPAALHARALAIRLPKRADTSWKSIRAQVELKYMNSVPSPTTTISTCPGGGARDGRAAAPYELVDFQVNSGTVRIFLPCAASARARFCLPIFRSRPRSHALIPLATDDRCVPAAGIGSAAGL